MTVDLDRLTRPFDPKSVKSRVIGGGRQAQYVEGATVIRRLNEATGNDWSMTVDRYWTEGNLTFALVTLTIPGHGSRQHIGVQATGGNQGEDAAAKGAITDAIKKTSTLFGVGLELYGTDHESDDGAPPAPPPRAIPPRAAQASAPGGPSGTPPAHGGNRLGALHAEIKAAGLRNGSGVADKDVHAIAHDLAAAAFGLGSLSEIDGEQLHKIIGWVKQWDAEQLVTKWESARQKAATRQVGQQAMAGAPSGEAGNDRFTNA